MGLSIQIAIQLPNMGQQKFKAVYQSLLALILAGTVVVKRGKYSWTTKPVLRI